VTGAVVVLVGFGALLVVIAFVIVLQRFVAKGHDGAVSGRVIWARFGIVLGLGLGLLAVGGAVNVWLAPRQEAIEQAPNDFVAAVRRGDENAVRGLSADGAAFDRAFLERVVRPSQEFKAGNTASGAHDACLRGVLFPQRAAIVFSLVEANGRWKVRRAAPSDPECDRRLED
jgi:hypothetical protein